MLGLSLFGVVVCIMMLMYNSGNSTADDIIEVCEDNTVKYSIDDYLIVDRMYYTYGGYIDRFTLVYSTAGVIQNTVVIGELEINYNSIKNEVEISPISKDIYGHLRHRVVIYTTSNPKLEDKIALDYFNEKKK